METRKILTISFSLLAVCVLAFVGIWIGINWENVKKGLSGTELYTKQDLEKAKEDGYNEALVNTDSLSEQLNYYKELVTTMSAEKNDLQSSNRDFQSRLNDANNRIAELQQSLENGNLTISELQEQIEYLQTVVAEWETANTAIVIFKIDNSVYDMQQVRKGETTTVETPTDTVYVKFNYWTVNGVQVDVSQYVIESNVTFEANVTHYYSFNFLVDGNYLDTYIGVENSFIPSADIPEIPQKNDYRIVGWSLDGENVVDFSQIPFTQNLTFSALYEFITISVNELNVVLRADSDGYYNPYNITQPITPNVINISYQSQQLSPGIDYTISYSNNSSSGVAKAVITGVGKYQGQRTDYYTIEGNIDTDANVVDGHGSMEGYVPVTHAGLTNSIWVGGLVANTKLANAGGDSSIEMTCVVCKWSDGSVTELTTEKPIFTLNLEPKQYVGQGMNVWIEWDTEKNALLADDEDGAYIKLNIETSQSIPADCEIFINDITQHIVQAGHYN